MKQTPILDRIQEDMRPGRITREGFLGNDSRRLGDILEEDHAEVQRLGLSHQDIARRMREMRDAGCRGLGEPIHVEPHFEVRVDSVRGKLPCPFSHAGLVQKTNTTVQNLESGEEITYTDLHIHMVGEHGFYEGRGGMFRIDPPRLVKILEIPVPDSET
ncbi:MAG: hypothetical protein HQ559_04960 [Lentisphaerae bacterium]|nr:hypothetical protein [Lentisphaerota bacterium]